MPSDPPLIEEIGRVFGVEGEVDGCRTYVGRMGRLHGPCSANKK